MPLQGCDCILLVHDRDRNNAANLRAQLEAILVNAPQTKKVVAIPEEELEAWLLSDAEAINKAMKLNGKFKTIHHPENVASPKEYLRDTVYKVSGKTKSYVNNVHNKLIAEQINTETIASLCPSFAPFMELFTKTVNTRKA